MRVAIGGIYHESNSFAPTLTTLDDIRAGGIEVGDEIIRRWTGTNSEIAGFLVAAEENGWEVLPALTAWIMPSGPLTDEALDTLTDELCQRTPADVDGVLLFVHGAMVSESSTDPDALWLGRVRKHVGADTPIVATADFHGNITPEMLACVNAIIGYDTYPHIDYRERGEEAGELLARMLDDAHPVRPLMRLVNVPVIPHLLRQFTGAKPMKRVMDAAHREEKRTEALWVSVFGGFAWADVPHNGLSIVVGTDDDADGATELARALALVAWQQRNALSKALTSTPTDAVKEALGVRKGPVVLVDTGDNVGAGSPGDYPTLLRELIKQQATGALVMLADPETVARAIEIGVRGEGMFHLGGKVDTRFGEPVEAKCRVRMIADGIYTNVGEMRDGITDDMGRTAVLSLNGITVVATERKTPMWNLEQLRSLGIEPTRLRIVVVKAAIAHRAAYDPIATKTIYVVTPGITALDIRALEYKHVRRPVLPLDPSFSYEISIL